jgi:hypothetical protein
MMLHCMPPRPALRVEKGVSVPSLTFRFPIAHNTLRRRVPWLHDPK